MHLPPITTPVHGCVPDVVVVVVDGGGCVVVVVEVEVEVEVVVEVVVEVDVGGGGGLVVDVGCVVVLDGGGAVVVVVDVAAVLGGSIVVVVDEGPGSPAGLDGTHSPNSGAKKKRRGAVTSRAAKHTRSIDEAPTVAPVGTHNTVGSRTRNDRWSATVTGNGGMNRVEVSDG